MLPLAFGAYLLAVRFGGPRLRSAGPAAFALVALAAWPLNAIIGFEQTNRVTCQFDTLSDDLAAGLPPELIGHKYDWQLWLMHPEIRNDFDVAARVGFTPFRHLAPPREAEARAYASSPVVQGPVTRVEVPAATAIRLTGGFEPKQDRFAEVRVRLIPADPTAERVELFRLVKNAPSQLLIRLDGRPARIEVIPVWGEGVFRVNRVELITTH
jgi:hypothetical protein